jgi:uncharacterized protein YjbI with pentapeptide repeats
VTPTAVGLGVALFFFLTWWLTQPKLSAAVRAQNLDYYDVARSVVVLLGIAGAGVALVVAWRRQTVQEHQLRLTDRDLRLRELVENTRREEQQEIEVLRQQERRDDQNVALLRDLQARYVDAASQLGHASAAIRLAGAYALGRLASEWSDLSQRQSCVDVLCAYLRMPAPTLKSGDPDFEEEEVRRSIVRLIADRLRPGSSLYWSGVGIDLSRAVLDTVDFSRLRIEGDAAFVETVFEGDSTFGESVFRGVCDFSECTFEGITFEKAHFEGDARFINCEIRGTARFTWATFDAKSLFHGCRFKQDSVFSSSTFRGPTDFEQCQFVGLTRFQATVFSKDARFTDSEFKEDALFGWTVFERGVTFGSAKFRGEGQFGYARVAGRAGFSKITAERSISLEHAVLRGGLKMTEAVVHGDVILDHAEIMTSWHLDDTTFKQRLGVAGVQHDVDPRLTGAVFATPPRWNAMRLKSSATT